MAPDLNSVPPSPHRLASAQSSTASSRRVSQAMGPPPIPLTGSLETASTSPPSAPTGAPPLGGSGVGPGPGPLRHPRPLTAAELHLELEKEQEAIVNRLTRELTLLRQQTASVVSTASSASTGIAGDAEHGANIITGPAHPTTSRRHRSSSNLSSQSTSLTGLNSSTVSGIAPARDAAASASTQIRGQSRRRDSTTLSRRPDLPSSPSASQLTGDSQTAGFTRHGGHHVRGNSGSMPPHALESGSFDARSPMRTSSTSSSRFEEVAHQRAELENVRRENESLRRRIQELERQLHQRSSRLSEEHPREDVGGG